MKSTIVVVYTVKWVVCFAPNYVFVNNNRCFNSKTNRELKQVYKKGSIGYNIKGKFYTLSNLRKQLVKPTVNKQPF